MTTAASKRGGWAGIADWYDRLVASASGPHEHAIAITLRLAGDVRGASVLDLACGQGIAARALAAAGAGAVTGVDLSAEMIAHARRHEAAEPLGIRYLVDDARSLPALTGDAFDLVTCQLALMDIPDLPAVLAGVARALRHRGAFVFVIGHPCFLAPDAQTITGKDGMPARVVGDYLTERFWRSQNPEGVRRVGNHHRTLSTYLNALREAGLRFDRGDESPAGDLLAAQNAVYQRIPIFFGCRAVKAGG
jgi:ubiquinone/menaquinone biosynthesis C-methylase UbiE